MTATAPRPTAHRAPPQGLPVLPLALAAVAVLAVVAVVLGSSGEGGGSDAVETAPVTVVGEPLPAFAAGAKDAAVGMPAPAVTGQDLRGAAIGFDPGEHPTILVFAAHWCPHCQAEVDALSPWLAAGGAGDVLVQTISTSVDASAPNYPPSAWFEREGWPGAVMADSGSGAAAQAFGLSGYPFFVFVDDEGRVTGRHSGELGPEALREVITSLGGTPGDA
jgi:cytochrome c biogenesis protein CcmG, thiol:disulfide interchange protein DsbE